MIKKSENIFKLKYGQKDGKVGVVSAQPLLQDVICQYLNELRTTHRQAATKNPKANFATILSRNFEISMLIKSAHMT